jgi:hypothetical protein
VIVERYKLRFVGIVNYSKMVVSLETKWGTILETRESICRVRNWVVLFDGKMINLFFLKHVMSFAYNIPKSENLTIRPNIPLFIVGNHLKRLMEATNVDL